MAIKDIGITVKKSAPGWHFEVAAKSKHDGYRNDDGLLIVASGHRDTKALAETAAAREAAVYVKMAKKKK